MKKFILTILFVLTVATAWAQPSNSPLGPVPPDNTPYNATTWDGSMLAPTQNAMRDWMVTVVGVTDHGALLGLTDDDHPQYFLEDGSRDVSGSILPDTGNSYDIGTVADYFRYGYFSNVYSTIFTGGVAGSVGGSLVLHDAGIITLHDDGNNTSVQIGPVVDGTTTLGLAGSVNMTGSLASAGVSSSAAVSPSTADGAALGATDKEWSDAYFASGSVFYFQDDQSVTLTSGVAGLTFNMFPITPSAAPDADYEVANKKYVDDNVGGGGDVATDAIWDAAGELAVGTGANTAHKLAAGTAGYHLVANGAADPVWTKPREFSKLNLTEDTSISEAQILANKYISNQGDAGEQDDTLPAVSYVATVVFIVEEDQVIEVNPPAGEAFLLDLVALDANDCVDSPTDVGAMLTCVRMQNSAGTWVWSCYSAGNWVDTGASD